jgi:hypothetical protein
MAVMPEILMHSRGAPRLRGTNPQLTWVPRSHAFGDLRCLNQQHTMPADLLTC